jgi:hypothetical protein
VDASSILGLEVGVNTLLNAIAMLVYLVHMIKYKNMDPRLEFKFLLFNVFF